MSQIPTGREISRAYSKENKSIILMRSYDPTNISCFPRHLEDVLETPWKTRNCYTKDVLKIFSKYLGDQTDVCWEAYFNYFFSFNQSKIESLWKYTMVSIYFIILLANSSK